MCGIVGYIGRREACGVILGGLRRLEYRGYDSAGIAVVRSGRVECRRSAGKLSGLIDKVSVKALRGRIGIGHTRWATHGRPSEANAHPHVEGGVAVVHNGIIENHLELRAELKAAGARFKSETDTEILSHLISRGVKKGLKLEDAVREALRCVKGTYAVAVVSAAEPDKIVGARMECPLVVGVGSKEAVLSSDIPAILDTTRKAVFLEDGDVVVITGSSVDVTTLDGREVTRPIRTIDWSPVMAEKGGYRHFMLKEIYEQPRAVSDTMRGALMEEAGDVFLDGVKLHIKDVKRISMVACGTSWHASLIGKFLIEELAGIPVEVDLASEFRYRSPLVSKDTLVVAVSQSGETADTLAALKEARRRGAKAIAVCNVVESSLAREARATLYTHAGPEIGVASTKAFTTQIVALYMLAVHLGRRNGRLTKAAGRELVKELLRLPHRLEAALALDSVIVEIAKKYFEARDFLYLARGINYPIALEGALKLKELSYIHAEGYPAGEMKHGPIALVDEKLPVVVLAPRDAHYPKVMSNMEEVRARGGRIIAVVSEGDEDAASKAEAVITVPHATHHLTPVIMSIPMQLLAYHIAVFKGTDVDQPRNLAKSVTVE